MTKSTLIKLSLIGDALGLVPVLGTIISIPLLIVHYSYAGPRALWCLIEMLPMVGFLPIFSIAAAMYPDNEQVVAASEAQMSYAELLQRALPNQSSLSPDSVAAVEQVMREADSLPKFDELPEIQQIGWCILRGYQLGRGG